MATQSKEFDSKAGALPETQAVSETDVAIGASFIAAGIGSTTLGLMVVGAEASEGFKTFLTFHAGAGPLSGKTTIAVIAFFLSWGILHYVLKGKQIPLVTSFWIGIALTAVGLILTYPPVFLSFAP